MGIAASSSSRSTRGGKMTIAGLSVRALLCACCVAASFACAEMGVTDNEIILGMSAPFHGVNGVYGREMKEAIDAYFESVNAGGGVHGRKLKLLNIDDSYD